MRALALASSLIVSVLLAEALVLLAAGEQPKFPRHVVRAPWGLRYNEPGARYRHKSADMTTHFRINRQGMRADRDYAYAKRAGVKRIVSLGDSFTIGYEVDVEDCFSSVLEAELRKAGVRAEVLNFGVSGFSTAEEVLYLERELLKYSPDVVLVSFFGNDFEDNQRAGLFRLEGDDLVLHKREYVPAGRLGDYLNRSWFFNLLSERSNAFVFAKERLTLALKGSTADDDKRFDPSITECPQPGEPTPEGGEALTRAIFEHTYDLLRARGIPLVIQSIPQALQGGDPDVPYERRELCDWFPLARFDMERPGVYSAPAQKWLEPYRGRRLLYFQRSHWHWTPLSHRISGKHLATLMLERGLLR